MTVVLETGPTQHAKGTNISIWSGASQTTDRIDASL